MQVSNLAAVAAVAVVAVVLALNVDTATAERQVHHKKHHHHKHHHKGANASNSTAAPAHALPATNVFPHSLDGDEPKPNSTASENNIMEKMKKLEAKLTKEEAIPQPPTEGKIEVNGPVPADFAERFIQAAAMAAGVNTVELTVQGTQPMGAHGEFAEISFRGPKDVVLALENQAADPDSKLVHSPIRSFLIARDSDTQEVAHSFTSRASHHRAKNDDAQAEEPAHGSADTDSDDESSAQVESGSKGGIDIDTAMPYGELEPFGREDTAQELTESSVKDSDEMVDQVERAEVAEEKRAVFRALTRLRGAAITSFDGVARSQTGNIDEYNKVHQWRNTHPLHHLADEESDISKWAFPDNADF